MNIIEEIKNLETILKETKSLPGTSKVMIDKSRSLDILKDVIENLPSELDEAGMVTRQKEAIIDQADKEAIVNKLSESIKQFDRTQANLDELVLLSKSELLRAKPIISELTKASFHLNNILESLDNPKTLNDLQDLASTTSSLTKKIDQMSADVGNIMEDEELINALKRVTIGLSKLFDDIYP